MMEANATIVMDVTYSSPSLRRKSIFAASYIERSTCFEMCNQITRKNSSII